MNTFPKRPEQHVLDNTASKHLERKLPDEWIHESIRNDYGIDYNVGIVNQGNVIGPNFSIQLKGKKDISKEDKAKTQLKRSTLNYWNNRFEPTLVVIYCNTSKKSYYKWFNKSEFDLTSQQDEFTFTISKSNLLDEIDWHVIQNEIIELFALKHRLYHLYNISLSKLNNNEFGLIWSTYSNGKFEDTIEYCKQQLKKENDILWHSMLSHAYYSTYQYRLGLFHNQKAQKLLEFENDEVIINETSRHLKINRASILAEIGRNTKNNFYLFEATDIWIELIEDEKIQDSSLFYNFANTCLLLRKLDLSEFYFQESLKLNKNNAQAWTNLADVYSLSGKYKKELQCYQVAIEIDKTLKNALIGEAIAYYRLEQFQTSLDKFLLLKQYEKEWQVNYSDYYFYLSECYHELGQKEKSKLVAEEGLYFDPGNINLINKLSKLYSTEWQTNPLIKKKAENLYSKRLQIFVDDIVSLNELVHMKIADNVNENEIAEFVKSHISIEGNPTNKEIIESFKKNKST